MNNWTPRGLVSGPIRTGKAWFMDALEGEYDLTIYTELPAGADRYSIWRGSNLSKVQINLAQNNNLTVSLLVNSLFSPHAGLDPLDPISTTQRYSTNAYMFTAKDQHLFQSGMLLEAGVATSTFYSSLVPMGDPNLRRHTQRNQRQLLPHQSRPGRAHRGNRQPVPAAPARGGKARVQAGH